MKFPYESKGFRLHDVLGFVALAFACVCPAAEMTDGDRPNILFISIDDLNDWVGCLGGHPQALTPHIDALAARGTKFTNAFSQHSVCSPSRASIMTGQYPASMRRVRTVKAGSCWRGMGIISAGP